MINTSTLPAFFGISHSHFRWKDRHRGMWRARFTRWPFNRERRGTISPSGTAVNPNIPKPKHIGKFWETCWEMLKILNKLSEHDHHYESFSRVLAWSRWDVPWNSRRQRRRLAVLPAVKVCAPDPHTDAPLLNTFVRTNIDQARNTEARKSCLKWKFDSMIRVQQVRSLYCCAAPEASGRSTSCSSSGHFWSTRIRQSLLSAMPG